MFIFLSFTCALLAMLGLKEPLWQLWWWKLSKCHVFNRGYYTVLRRYKFYVLVARTILSLVLKTNSIWHRHAKVEAVNGSCFNQKQRHVRRGVSLFSSKSQLCTFFGGGQVWDKSKQYNLYNPALHLRNIMFCKV